MGEKRTFTLTLTASDVLLDDIVAIAEGRKGIDLWAIALGNHAWEQSVENGEPKHPISFVVDRDLIVRGLEALFTDGFQVGGYIQRAVIDAISEDDSFPIDCEIADVIVQAAVFGEIIYG